MALPVLALQKGLVNLGAGTYTAESIIHCESDGDFTLTWNDATPNVPATTTSYSMIAGEDRGIYDADTIEITAGTFTMARQ